MSNRISIDPTEFRNVRSGQKTLGVRVYDDYSTAYDNNWDSIPDDDLDVIEKVLECDNKEIQAIMDFVKEEKKGIDVDGTYYDWDEIKEVFQVAMKLSAKKKGEIYDLVHHVIKECRIEIQKNYMTGVDPKQADKIDYQIAQLEIPLAQKVMKLLDKTYDNS